MSHADLQQVRPVAPSTKRRLVKVFAWLSLVLAAPASLLVVLIGVNSVNPLQTIFVGEFGVQNKSGEPLRFWVAGKHESGNLHLLPLFATAFPALPSLRTGGFKLADGRSARIVYDWDDIDFSVIVVERGSGEFRAVDVDTEKRGRDCCRPPSGHAYAIPSVDTLRVASPAEVAVLTEDASFGLRLALVLTCPLIPVGLFWWSRRLARAAPLRESTAA